MIWSWKVSMSSCTVAQRLAAVRGEIASETDGLRSSLGQLQQEAGALRALRDQDVARSQAALEAASSKVSEELTAALSSEVGALRQESKLLEESLLKSIMEVCDKVEKEGEATGEQRRQGAEEMQQALEERAAELEERLEKLAAELRDEASVDREERERLRAALDEGQARSEASLAQLEEGLRGQGLVSEARFRESQAAMAALEERQQTSLKEALSGATGQVEEKDLRIKYELEVMKSSLTADFRERITTQEQKLQQVVSECRGELDFIHSAWARNIEWNADIDVQALEGEGSGGRYTLEGPTFSAAGLRPLQLELRMVREGKSRRWTCGVFLHAPAGRMHFKLTVLGRSQSFDADFGETPEWGSQKLAIFERVPAKLTVGLEILDVSAPLALPLRKGGASEITSSLRITDAAQAAAKEAAALRATMVRRVEWRIAHVSERLAAAREAAALRSGDDEEALEPLCSPPFAAAGYEGLQLQLYPVGYRPRGDESCGFFLVCPRGMFVKCRAFVGDAVRNFEHQYDAREPYGRGSFCRLADKVDGDDSVVCGIEFLEVRQEQTAQVRGGPFGNTADQLKVVNNPSVGGMEVVRELREVPFGAADKRLGRSRQQTKSGGLACEKQQAAMRATAPPGAALAQTLLRDSKSLPSLLPTVPAMGAGAGAGMAPLSPPKQVDSLKWRG
mmetsp:Transcript_84401/g.243635  ORF Transcript_84401/g.243635 Transcript_84401/m.243635 type:complete len:680 (-) Transcript_84401:216-2255(-)